LPKIFILPHCWPFMQLEIIEISSININHRESRSSSALPVPISTKTLQVVFLACHIRR
jgi:hypothetical protein